MQTKRLGDADRVKNIPRWVVSRKHSVSCVEFPDTPAALARPEGKQHDEYGDSDQPDTANGSVAATIAGNAVTGAGATTTSRKTVSRLALELRRLCKETR